MAKNKPKILKMKPQPVKITRMEFSATHYSKAQFPSDGFYTSLANKLYGSIYEMLKGSPGISVTDVSKRMALSLACYVEDLVSDSKIWSSFTSLHEKKYGRKMPFYDIEGKSPADLMPYSDDYPSLRAVQFLLWNILDDAKEDTVINPQNPALGLLAMKLLPELIDAYEEAPESPMRPIIVEEKILGIPVFFQIRAICDWLCNGCYLTRVWNKKKMIEDMDQFLTHIFDKAMADDGQKEYVAESFIPLNAKIGPLALPAFQWYAEMVSLEPEEGEEKYLPILRNLESIPYQFYSFKTVSADKATVVDPAGKEFEMSPMTMPGEKFNENIKPGSSIMMSLVRFDGLWVMNGLSLQPLPKSIYEETREKYIKNQELSSNVYKQTLKALKNKRIGVCVNYDEYVSKIFKDDDWKEHTDPKITEKLNDVDNLVYFLNSDGQVSMLINWAGCIKLRGNKYYDKEEAKEEGINLIFDRKLTTPEMREYIIDNNLIPDAALNSLISEKVGRELFQNNIRFFNDYCSRNTLQYLSPESFGPDMHKESVIEQSER